MTNRELKENMHAFIDWIAYTIAEPDCWPLTQEQQSNFIRRIVATALQIQKSEAYRKEVDDLDNYQVGRIREDLKFGKPLL